MFDPLIDTNGAVKWWAVPFAVLLAVLGLVIILALAGCYYRLTDRDTGAVYYTNDSASRWSLGPGESVRFTDAITGQERTLHYPRFETISRREYDAAVEGRDR